MLWLLAIFTIKIIVSWQPPICCDNTRSNIESKVKTIDHRNEKIINNEWDVHEYIVSTGDTLTSIFNQYGINIENIIHLTAIDKKLCYLRVGQQLSWKLATNGNLQNLTWEISDKEKRTYNRVGNSFKMSSILQKNNWVNYIIKGTINANIHDIGLTNNEINALIKVMQWWQIDFHKLKKGDQLSVLISREISHGKNHQSQLTGVHLRSNSKDYYAIRAEDGMFYDLNGICLAKSFLRFPTTKQFRISSNFNLHRLNPITGRVMPHRGVDFAMPQGTPVLATSDGEVIVAKHSNAAGFYISVRHGHTYITRYMHLCKLLVKPGQKVKRGDRIALSGNTGRSTGPHLHYEVWINQQAVNPLTARLPNNIGLTGKDRHNYLMQVNNVITQLQFE